MANSKKQELVEGIEQELTCAVCLDRFTEPKVLPCLHTYCKGCIDGLVAKTRKEQQAEENKVVCPKCREKHAVPDAGASGFTSNFTVKNLVELLQVHEASDGGKYKEKLRCENGVDDNVAVARCLNCSIYLCESCWVLHKKMVATRKHETVSLEAIKKGGEKKLHKPQYCSDHEGEVLKLYCKTCSKPLCGDCTYVDHRDHKYVFIKDVRQELRQELEGTMEGLRKKEREFSDYLECLHKAQVKHKATAAACEQEINQAFDVFIQHLQQCRGEVLNKLQKTVTTDDKQMHAELEATELSVAKITSNLSFTERLLKSGSDTEVASMAGRTLERARTLRNVKCERRQALMAGTLNVGSFKASIQVLDKRFKGHVQNICHDFTDSQLTDPTVVKVEGCEKLDCGVNELCIKNVHQLSHLKLTIIHKASDGRTETEVPCSITMKTEDSRTVSFILRSPGKCTITVTVDGIPVGGTPCTATVQNKLALGTRVRRGPDWEYGGQDNNGLGTVSGDYPVQVGSACVRWDHGSCKFGYRWNENYKDLKIVDL